MAAAWVSLISIRVFFSSKNSTAFPQLKVRTVRMHRQRISGLKIRRFVNQRTDRCLTLNTTISVDISVTSPWWHSSRRSLQSRVSYDKRQSAEASRSLIPVTRSSSISVESRNCGMFRWTTWLKLITQRHLGRPWTIQQYVYIVATFHFLRLMKFFQNALPVATYANGLFWKSRSDCVLAGIEWSMRG